MERVSVIGLGTMGHGIAQTFALAGHEVRAFDDLASARGSALDRIRTSLTAAANAELLESSAIEPAISRITICDKLPDALHGAQFVTEAVREDLSVKQELFPQMEEHVDAETILASNTSSFPMTDIAVHMKAPQRALNTHWFNPPQIIPLVEVVPSDKTEAEIVDVTVSLLDSIGKTAVPVRKELPGFLVNRIQCAMMREVLHLMENEVASPEDIDRAVRASMGLRLSAFGPLQIWDYAGLDIAGAVYTELVKDVRSDRELPTSLRELVDAGHYGFKSGQGIYEYPEEERAGRLAERDRRYLSLIKLFHSTK